jgi:hypothetical protein
VGLRLGSFADDDRECDEEEEHAALVAHRNGLPAPSLLSAE